MIVGYRPDILIRAGMSVYVEGVSSMARPFAKAFYHSTEWQRCREAYAQSVHYLCEDCLKRGIYRPGVIVHHIEELTPFNITNPEITLGFNNLRLVCRDCHAKEHSEKRYWIDEDGKIILR